MDYTHCALCPRACGVDRTAGQRGFCRCPDTAMVAKTMLHQWEEPALAGAGGSGAIFFGGCTLGCKYCQNGAISGGPVGKAVDGPALRQMMNDLVAQGAENIDLVTPTHFLPTVLEALEPKPAVPVVYNCGGYERVETLRQLEGKVDIYLPDLKYSEARLAKSLSGAADYFPRAKAAIREMVRQTGPVEMEDGLLRRGVVIRHLILPGQVNAANDQDEGHTTSHDELGGVLHSNVAQNAQRNESRVDDTDNDDHHQQTEHDRFVHREGRSLLGKSLIIKRLRVHSTHCLHLTVKP